MSNMQEHLFQVRRLAQVSSQEVLEVGSEPDLPGTDAHALTVPLKRGRIAWHGWRLLPWCLPHSEAVWWLITVGGLGRTHCWRAQWSWYPLAG